MGYTILGGFRAVTTTDLIQSMVMSLALIAVLGYGIVVAGGWGAVVENAQSLSGYLTMTASHDAVTGGATSYSLLDIVSTMAWGLGYFGMPHILLRFMAIEDEKKLVLSRRIATVWVVIAMAASIVIGMVGLGMTRPVRWNSSAARPVRPSSSTSPASSASTVCWPQSWPDSSLRASWRLRCPRQTARCWPLRPACPRTFCRSSATSN